MLSAPQPGRLLSLVCASSKNRISGSSSGCPREPLVWRPLPSEGGGRTRPPYNSRPCSRPLPFIRSAKNLSIVNWLALKLFLSQNHRNTETQRTPGILYIPVGQPLLQIQVLRKGEPENPPSTRYLFSKKSIIVFKGYSIFHSIYVS